ncbi:MAG: hypothetical protein ACXWDI_09510 [Nocardioides sp.]
MYLRAARVVAGVTAALWAVGFFGIIDLLVVVAEDGGTTAFFMLEAGWGALVTFLIAAPLVALSVQPTQGVHLAQLLAVAVAIAAAAVWSGYLPQLIPAVLVAGNALVIAALTAARFVGPPLDPWLRWLVVAGAVGGGAFAAMAVDNHPMTVPDITLGLDHLPMQAAIGLAVITVGMVATAGVGGRVPGWRVPVWTLAATIGWVGYWATVHPGLEGSPGRGFGWSAVAWAVAFVAVAESQARRTAPADVAP